MRLVGERPCTVSGWGAVRRRLQAIDDWVNWLPGLLSVARAGESVWMTFSDAQATRFCVELHNGEHSFGLQMVEGSVRSLNASLLWTDACVQLIVDLDLNRPLPGALARELEEVYPARLLSALFAEAVPLVSPSL